jgi:hypothetical protein
MLAGQQHGPSMCLAGSKGETRATVEIVCLGFALAVLKARLRCLSQISIVWSLRAPWENPGLCRLSMASLIRLVMPTMPGLVQEILGRTLNCA